MKVIKITTDFYFWSNILLMANTGNLQLIRTNIGISPNLILECNIAVAV